MPAWSRSMVRGTAKTAGGTSKMTELHHCGIVAAMTIRSTFCSLCIVGGLACASKSPPSSEPGSSPPTPASSAPASTPALDAAPSFVPGGPLPRHRGWLTDRDVEGLQRAGDDWAWASEHGVFRRPRKGGASKRVFTSPDQRLADFVQSTPGTSNPLATIKSLSPVSALAWFGRALK